MADDFEARAYELPEIWQDDWFGPEDRRRVEDVAALVPRGVRSLLDAGCGNGLFLRALQQDPTRDFSRLAGVDRSASALTHLNTERINASIDHLPFRNGEFEAVSCLEVLEHLPAATYARALTELARVAERYLIVSVPYREDLGVNRRECPQCRMRFNVDHHQRSFDEPAMAALFQNRGFRNIRTTRLGRTTVFWDRWLREQWHNLRTPPGFPSFGVCPRCGYHDVDKLRADLDERRSSQAAAFDEPLSPLRKRLLPFLPSSTFYRWVCAVYERA